MKVEAMQGKKTPLALNPAASPAPPAAAPQSRRSKRWIACSTPFSPRIGRASPAGAGRRPCRALRPRCRRSTHRPQRSTGGARGELSRTLTLPTDVDGTKAKASFKDGVLELTLPKLEPTQRRTIKVE